MNRINCLELIDVSFSCKPQMRNFNSWPETLSSFSYTFSSGNVYAIISEPGGGGWALSYLLAGRVRSYKGNIYINRELLHSRMLGKYGWYVGEEMQERTLTSFFRQKTVREQLESCNLDSSVVDRLIDMFELSPSRLDRQIKYISNERWNASAAIGLGLGRQVFCFPWLDDMWKSAIRERLRHCSEILRQNNCIVIIPTSNLQIINDFVDEIVYL